MTAALEQPSDDKTRQNGNISRMANFYAMVLFNSILKVKA